MPSTTDTFGNVVLEAQASGIPIIVSNVGATPENIVPEKTGLTFDAADAGSLAGAMYALIDGVGRRREMGVAARAYMLQRGFGGAFEELWKLYVSDAPQEGSDGNVERFLADSIQRIAGRAS